MVVSIPSVTDRKSIPRSRRSSTKAIRLRIVRPKRANPGNAEPPVSLAFVVRDNLRQRRSIERVYMEAITHARHRIDLVTPPHSAELVDEPGEPGEPSKAVGAA